MPQYACKKSWKKENYSFKVGYRPLSFDPKGFSGKLNKASCNDKSFFHHALLLDNYLFEYGKKYGEEGFRHNYYYGDPSFDWISDIEGTSSYSPDELVNAINLDGSWTPEKYDFVNHNCQSFVLFCLKKINSEKAEKYSTFILEYQKK